MVAVVPADILQKNCKGGGVGQGEPQSSQLDQDRNVNVPFQCHLLLPLQ